MTRENDPCWRRAALRKEDSSVFKHNDKSNSNILDASGYSTDDASKDENFNRDLEVASLANDLAGREAIILAKFAIKRNFDGLPVEIEDKLLEKLTKNIADHLEKKFEKSILSNCSKEESIEDKSTFFQEKYQEKITNRFIDKSLQGLTKETYNSILEEKKIKFFKKS